MIPVHVLLVRTRQTDVGFGGVVATVWRTRAEALSELAEFLDTLHLAPAARCLLENGDYERAGQVWREAGEGDWSIQEHELYPGPSSVQVDDGARLKELLHAMDRETRENERKGIRNALRTDPRQLEPFSNDAFLAAAIAFEKALKQIRDQLTR